MLSNTSTLLDRATDFDTTASIGCIDQDVFSEVSNPFRSWASDAAIDDRATAMVAPSSSEVLYGSLSYSDDLNPLRVRTYKDDYGFTMEKSGQVKFNLDSNQFDTYLQVIDFNTGKLLASNDDFGTSTDAQITLNLRSGSNVVIRATSAYSYNTGVYRLTATTFDTPAPAPVVAPVPVVSPIVPPVASPTPNPVTSPTPSPVPNPTPAPVGIPFNSEYGYGVANAATAVARALGKPAFAEVPNLGGNNWGNDFVNAPTAWANGYTGQNIIVAVVDSGVDYTHVDLGQNIWRNAGEVAGNGIDDDRNGFVDDVIGWDFVGNENNPMDEESHGTHVAGTIAAGNNGFGVTGVAYNAKIMPVRVLNAQGSSESDSVSRGIRYAADNGARVINLSLGGKYNQVTIDAVRYATLKGSIVVMAAGNDGLAQPGSPASSAIDFGIAVGAIDRNVSMADFSNRAGTNPAMRYVVAPGVDILSTVPGGRYDAMNGTSMAAPAVAGVVALMLSANPNLTPAQVRQIMIETAYRGPASSTSTASVQSWDGAIGSSMTRSWSTAIDSVSEWDNTDAEWNFEADWCMDWGDQPKIPLDFDILMGEKLA
jgi:subtilisin family serine protease